MLSDKSALYTVHEAAIDLCIIFQCYLFNLLED